ncbi:hypothetical protein [Rubritalea tangerina]|uniref:Uncharacterized protein n=1 Tax=Rubritalea tangerina TaxID=430798 RepID=A0ABW4ZDQ7_9BACT
MKTTMTELFFSTYPDAHKHQFAQFIEQSQHLTIVPNVEANGQAGKRGAFHLIETTGLRSLPALDLSLEAIYTKIGKPDATEARFYDLLREVIADGILTKLFISEIAFANARFVVPNTRTESITQQLAEHVRSAEYTVTKTPYGTSEFDEIYLGEVRIDAADVLHS